ncbi:peptidase M23 [Alicyclobacillus cellulosilyticus]|uniref:Peptidase M23 n=1 Tax=Alicyclobacillus cellulosilyticus TaxID=1003997 RepID=A0A917KF10_9BACL|nr:peptidase M23 [Alicyclobacillus cellulosilyticus]
MRWNPRQAGLRAFGLALAAALWVPWLDAPPSYADKLTEAKQKMQALEAQKVQTLNHLQSLKAQQRQLEAQIVQIEHQIDDLNRSIASTRLEIYRRNLAIARVKRQIARTEAHIAQQYGVLQRRLRVMYMAGQASYLDVLFSATSFADFLDRMQLLSMIAAEDRQVLDEIQAAKRRLEANRSELVRQQQAARHVYVALINKQTQVQMAERRERRLLADVKDQQRQEEIALQNETSAMQNLKALIQQLQSEVGTYTGPSDGWVWPVPGYHTISSGYGWRTWSDGTREFHNGIDIPAPIGTPIVAATGGKVLYAGPASGFGDWIVIESANGLFEIYGHMYAWEIKVKPGEIVHAGQQIAGVGSNGFSTGPHLHFTIATGFDSSGYPVSVDPTKYVGG